MYNTHMTQQHKEHIMFKEENYTRIIFNRSDLFEICRWGFVAQKIGDLWCEGWMLTNRLPQVTVPWRAA